MFLQLLASELSKLPEFDTDLKQAEQVLQATPEVKTLDDLVQLSGLRTKTYPFEGLTTQINLRTFETAVLKVKHFQSGNQELEDDFV